jgi:cytochrome c-type biogenesis protein CcmF
MVGALAETATRIKLFRAPLRDSLRRAVGLPRANWGSMLAHFGLGLTLLGIVASTAWTAETIKAVKPGGTIGVAGYELTLVRMFERQASNHRDLVAQFDIRRGGVSAGSIESAKEHFSRRQMTVTQAGLKPFGPSELYVSLGDTNSPDGAVAVRAQWKPLVLFIWFGAGITAFGGMVSLSDRRLRVGAPRRAAAAKPVGPQPEPAE